MDIDESLYLYTTAFYDEWFVIMEELEQLEVGTFGRLALRRFT